MKPFWASRPWAYTNSMQNLSTPISHPLLTMGACRRRPWEVQVWVPRARHKPGVSQCSVEFAESSEILAGPGERTIERDSHIALGKLGLSDLLTRPPFPRKQAGKARLSPKSLQSTWALPHAIIPHRRPWWAKATDHTVPGLGPPHQPLADTSRIPHRRGDVKDCCLAAISSRVSEGEGALCLLEVCGHLLPGGGMPFIKPCVTTPQTNRGIPRTGPATSSFQHALNPKTHDEVKFSACPAQPLPTTPTHQPRAPSCSCPFAEAVHHPTCL